MTKPKLTLADIEFNPTGITCNKITSLTDSQLNELEHALNDALQVSMEYCNTEEYRHLTSSYWGRSYYTISKSEKYAVYKILLKYIK